MSLFNCFLLVVVFLYNYNASGLSAFLFDNYDDDDNDNRDKEKENDQANDCRVSAVFLDFDNLSFSRYRVGGVGSEGGLVDRAARVLHRVVGCSVGPGLRIRQVIVSVRFFIRAVRSVTALVGVRRRL